MSTASLAPQQTDSMLPASDESAPKRAPHGPLTAIKQGLTLTGRSLIKVKHSPEQLLDLTLQPIIFVIMFVYLFGGAVAGNQHDYLEFVLPGILVQTVIFATAGTGIGLSTDLSTGIFDRFRSMPIARSAPLTGTIIGDICKYVVSLLVVLIFGTILGFRIGTNPLSAFAACALVMVFAFALCWVSALLGLVIKNPRTVQGMSFLVMFPLTFGSNIFVPTDTLPGWLQAWVNINPVTYLVDATRGLMLGGTDVAGPITGTLIWTAIILAIFAPLAVSRYRKTV